MQLIIWRVRQRGYLLTLIGAIITAFLSHICCIGPLLLVPLGLSGVSVFLEKTVSILTPWILLVPVILLGLTGWRIYRNPQSHPVEKAAFWLSVVVVSLMIIL
jgi:mercuric ion transport protein